MSTRQCPCSCSKGHVPGRTCLDVVISKSPRVTCLDVVISNSPNFIISQIMFITSIMGACRGGGGGKSGRFSMRGLFFLRGAFFIVYVTFFGLTTALLQQVSRVPMMSIAIAEYVSATVNMEYTYERLYDYYV